MEETAGALRLWNPWWAEKIVSEELKGVDRVVKDKLLKLMDLRHIKDVIGVRRCGKTTVLYQIIDELIKKGVNPQDIAFVNFDDAVLNTADFDDILKAIYQTNPNAKYVFLDEVQEKKGWERWVRRLYDLKKFKQIFVTGSNASLLSKDIGRVLTGRHISSVLFPFSFKEFLVINGWKHFNKQYLLAENAKLLYYLNRYLKNGGFPEAINKDDAAARRILSNIYNDIIARDVSMRHNINPEKINLVGRYLLTNIASEYSYRSIARSVNINTETVEKYIGFLKEAFLVFSVDVFSFKLKVQYKQNKKIYGIDTGLSNAVSSKFSENVGRLAENLVLMGLKRRGKDVYYWKTRKGEVDFVVKEGLRASKLIQVCWRVKNKKTKQREVKSLLKAMKQFKLKEGLILTKDYSREEKIENRKIEYVPLGVWLLEE